jgi:hypothetical protein
MSEQQQSQQRKSSYTSVAQMYDRDHSSIKFGYVNKDIYIEVAPVFDAMAGKDVVAKGEKMYDYDSRLFSSIRATNLPLLISQVNALDAGEIHEFAFETANRLVTFGAGGLFDGIDGMTISVVEKDANGNEVRDVLFAFAAPSAQVLGYKYTDENDEPVEEPIEVTAGERALDWEWFVSWINNAVLENSYGIAEQGARLGAPVAGAGGRATPQRSSNTPARAKGKGFNRPKSSARTASKPAANAGSAVDNALGNENENIDFDEDLPM